VVRAGAGRDHLRRRRASPRSDERTRLILRGRSAARRWLATLRQLFAALGRAVRGPAAATGVASAAHSASAAASDHLEPIFMRGLEAESVPPASALFPALARAWARST